MQFVAKASAKYCKKTEAEKRKQNFVPCHPTPKTLVSITKKKRLFTMAVVNIASLRFPDLDL